MYTVIVMAIMMVTIFMMVMNTRDTMTVMILSYYVFSVFVLNYYASQQHGHC